jgi:cholinesterase
LLLNGFVITSPSSEVCPHLIVELRDTNKRLIGDPKRITIFGESAGGFSVDYYAYAWPKDPIVNGFIAQSGTASGAKGMGRDQPANFNTWYKLSAKLGCGGAEAGEKTVACVRAKSGKEVTSAATSLSLNFGPRADGKVVHSDNDKRGKAGDFIKRVSFCPSGSFNQNYLLTWCSVLS